MQNKLENVLSVPNIPITYHTASIDGVDIFYRQVGSKKKSALLLLHGFPTSSHMFRNLMPLLAEHYHIIAPDYPGFGYSGMPDHKKFPYTFDKFADLMEKLLKHLHINKYALYVFDYGAPVGFRLFHKNPANITAIVSQNGNAYEEGITPFWDPIKTYWKSNASKDREAIRWLTSAKATKWQYQDGVPKDRLEYVSPDAAQIDQSLMDRPGNAEIQLDLFYDYRTNLPLYPIWQESLRTYKPPFLAVWGKNDSAFAAAGALAFKKDLPDAEIHFLDTGHFLLETHAYEMAAFMQDFLSRKIKA